MTYLLDTNFCIQYLNGRSENVRRRLESERSENIVLCSVVKAELLFGAVKSTRPTENLDRLRFFFRRFSSLPFDDMAAGAKSRFAERLDRHPL